MAISVQTATSKHFSRWLYVLAALSLLGGLEYAVRSWILAPGTTRVDPVFGPVLAPGVRLVESREGWARWRTDAEGRLDRPMEGDPQSRILLLGDSYSVGQQVGYGRRFADRIETLLPGVEVVDAAQSGWYPPYYLAWAKTHPVRDFDILIVQLNDGDLFERHRADRIRYEREGHGEYRLHLPHPGISVGSKPPWWRRVMRRSAVLTLVLHRSKLLVAEERRRLSGTQEETDEMDRLGDADEAVDYLVALDADLRATHSRILYLYIPQIDYLEPGAPPAWPLCRSVYQRFARRSQAHLVDVTVALQEAFRSTGQPLHGFHNSMMGGGHLNARGHDVVATVVAEALRPWLDGGAEAITKSASNTEDQGR